MTSVSFRNHQKGWGISLQKGNIPAWLHGSGKSS